MKEWTTKTGADREAIGSAFYKYVFPSRINLILRGIEVKSV